MKGLTILYMSNEIVIFTGGSGLLGTEFKKINPDFLYPESREFYVTDYEQMRAYVEKHKCTKLIHAAATTSPPTVQKDPLKAIHTNIIGTANIVRLCMEFDMYLIYISTDYVFSGRKSMYKETADLNPVNKYAWSKLGGECAVRMYDKSLIIRTTFGSNVFPYDKAFTDQWTSRESVSVIAEKISKLVSKDVTGVIHVGGSRKTVWEYAKSLEPSKEIGKLSIKDVPFIVPIDTSLNCSRYNSIFKV